MIVLADDHDAPRAISRRDRRRIVSRVRECRLFDEDVFAALERPNGQIEVKGRWNRDHHRIDRGIVDRLIIAAVGPRAPEASAVVVRPRAVAARIRPHGVRAERAKVPAVDGCDEATPEEGYADRLGHRDQPIISASR